MFWGNSNLNIDLLKSTHLQIYGYLKVCMCNRINLGPPIFVITQGKFMEFMWC